MSLQEIQAFESALGQDGVEMLSATLEAYNDPQALGRQLGRTYGDTHLGRIVSGYVNRIILFDPQESRENHYYPLNTYLRGGLLGVHVVYNFLSPHSIEQVCAIEPTVVVTDQARTFGDIPTVVFDSVPSEEKVSVILADAGRRGWEESPEYHDLINDWIGGISPDRRYQNFARMGLGLVLANIRGAYSLAKLADGVEMHLELERAHALDYDVEFNAE